MPWRVVSLTRALDHAYRREIDRACQGKLPSGYPGSGVPDERVWFTDGSLVCMEHVGGEWLSDVTWDDGRTLITVYRPE